MRQARPEVAAQVANTLGECVLWDDTCATLRWVDIEGKRLWQMASGQTAQPLALPARLACMAMTGTPGQLLLGLEHGLARFDLARQTLTPLLDIETDLPFTRLNDGRCDRHGNFLFGTIDEEKHQARGSWYRFDRTGQLARLDLPAVAIPNSLCLALDGRRLYFSDGITSAIQCCEYDPDSGAVSAARIFAPIERGFPDGSCVDAEGCVWTAVWGAAEVLCHRPDGSLARRIALPASQPTCVAFGGAALDTLYITSASVGLSAQTLELEPLAGSLFALHLADVRGLPESRWGGRAA